jgi:MFS transporter, putative metabolite:H+ symporter
MSVPTRTPQSRDIIARLEGIDPRSMSRAFVGILGLGFFFNFYDIFDINVSFIQTCAQIHPGCTPLNAGAFLRLPVLVNLAGYVVGALGISPLSDRVGRRRMLMITLAITTAGALYTALCGDYSNFVVARCLTGIGIGADLAVVNTYIGEIAPRHARARYTARTFVMSTLGALAALRLGLLLTTDPAPWPSGLPFALASTGFATGWRWMYGIAVALGLMGIGLRTRLPESPRWLISRGRLADAAAAVASFGRGPGVHGGNAEHGSVSGATAGTADPATASPSGAPASGPQRRRASYREVFGNPTYLRRALLLFAVWFIGYITVYGYSAGFTVLLTGLHYTPPEAGIIAAVGTLGFVAQGLFSARYSERLERRHWLPIAALITVLGAIMVAVGGHDLTVAFAGAFLIFFGFNVWVPPTYALSSESFPTRARSTGFGLVDGVGHLGGGVGLLVVAPLVPDMNALEALLLMSSFLVVAAVLGQFAIHTRNRPLEEVSP